MNNVCLMGNLTKDPVVKEYGNKKAEGLCARITLAVRRNAEDTDFINCVAFGKTAEMIDSYVTKGDKIAIEGRIQTGSYDKDGIKYYTTDVIISRVHFAGSKKNDDVEDVEEEETLSKERKSYKRK